MRIAGGGVYTRITTRATRVARSTRLARATGAEALAHHHAGRLEPANPSRRMTRSAAYLARWRTLKRDATEGQVWACDTPRVDLPRWRARTIGGYEMTRKSPA